MVYSQHRSSLSKRPSSVSAEDGLCTYKQMSIRDSNTSPLGSIWAKNDLNQPENDLLKRAAQRISTLTDKPKQARHSACFLSVKTEITCACSDIHPFKKPETSGFPAQLVDISKLGLNSKIKKFSYSFICGKGLFSPPFRGGRIAFCLQSEPETLGFRRRE